MNGIASLSDQFPRALMYRSLGQESCNVVRESISEDPAFPYSERHLQCVWYDATWRPTSLRAGDGQRITVETPGRWNLEAGPDFLDAVVTAGPHQRRIQGDVEIHVRPEDWQRHGHHNDPRYAGVILHATHFPGSLAEHLLPPGCLQVPLKDALRSDPGFSFESIDLTAYPHAALPPAPRPCAVRLAEWSPDQRSRLLDAAGEQRLKLKACRMAAAIHEQGDDQLLYEEILCSLGYKHNRQPFRQLARRLPLQGLQDTSGGDPVAAYALLMGVSGLIPAKVSPRWDRETKAFVRQLWDRWWRQQAAWERVIMQAPAWRRGGIRPQNHPVRRMAFAASLFAQTPGIAGRITRLPIGPNWYRDAEALFMFASPMDYWKRRLSLGGSPQASDVALLGRRRAAAMLSNVLVPFLAAKGIPVSPLLDGLPAEEDNNLIRETAFALFGPDHNPALYEQGLKQQGLIQIYHDFCLNSRNACRACTLCSALDKTTPTFAVES
jgi:hypothetical protein